MIGRATRLARYVTPMDKSYTATARLGFVSDTLDAEGEPVPVEGPVPDADTIRAKLPDFTGHILQVPPMTSALKVDGRRLYDLHRQGVEVQREPRPVDIHAFDLLSTDPEAGTATFEISCSSGTYVRSLISDLAHSLGSGAYLTALRRTRVGDLLLGDASSPEELDETSLNNRIIRPEAVLGGLPAVEVGVDGRVAVCNGRKMRPFGVDGSYRVVAGEELLAVYRDEGAEARAEVVLCAP
ncbi:MAG: tRNA pseudouridine(55) synthase [uncultured Rubrobacteraceae bacterium]|uniref:tRNA pseudouridine(55) synthase n=1 Tax=uncultured Rubrobacteraceae bacterium TaxID=349277 RepID=A0A6J4PJR0_9ACTN|nr:MAG: tRNA pseudouridine(55) synthase [uncultured Rubrobacteraceae bacterium]